MERKIGYCMQCDFHDVNYITNVHKCKHPENKDFILSQHNLLYIVPKGCPLPNYDDEIPKKDADMEDVLGELYGERIT